MFCDLAGFTAHTERSDPEDVRARLTAFHTQVRQDVERFGGKVEKLMGDGVFSVFGVPTAHEDDPERAVRAALRIQESMQELNRANPSHALNVRISVTTGEAIIQLSDQPDREGIIGDVVNTASRLEAVAALGTVVVDERTYTATRHTIELVALDPVTVKGKTEPLSIWRATEAKSRYGVAVEEQPDTPFVGRGEELALLIDAYERTVARSTPQVVTIAGEPGVGKTRLIREFRLAIDDRSDLVFWRQGRCLPYGEGISFWAIGEIVKSQAGILESESPEVAIAKLEETVATLIDDPDDARWIALRLRPLIGVGSDAVDRAELFTAWTRFFEALSSTYPLIMVIEDLHWADDSVIDFLDHLTEWATESPILLVATARPELFSDRPEWTAGRRDAVTAGLDPLSNEDAVKLMGALADRPVMSADIQQALLDRSGGNPLYMTEYMRLAHEQDWFTRAERGEDLPLPDSINSIISARIDLLPPDEKTLLQTAAVVGRVFWTAALTFADVGTAEAVREGLRGLIRREMIRPVRRSSMQGHDEYTFAHVLIRDVAYGRLTRDERGRLHGSTARWLEAVSGDRASDVAELIAHHLSTSYELSPGSDAELERRIYRFLMMAVERASMLDASAARGFAERAIEFASDDQERGKALTEWGSLVFDDPEAAVAAFDEAIECYQRAGDREGEIDAVARLSRLRWFIGDAEETDAADARLLALIEGMAPSANVAQAMVSVAAKLQLRGREEEALDLVEQGLSVAQQVGDTKTYARALVVRGSSMTQIGDFSGIEDVEEGLRIQLDRNDARSAMSTYNNLATFRNDTGDLERGLELIEEAISYGTQRGVTSFVDWSHLTLCEALWPTGRWARLEEITTEYTKLQRVQGTQIEAGMKSWKAVLLHFRGRSSEAWSIMTSVLDSTRATKDPQGLVPTLALGIAMALAAGEERPARALVDEFVSVSTEHPVFMTLNLRWAAKAMIELGRMDDLKKLVRLANREVSSISGGTSSARGSESPPWIRAKLDIVEAAIAAAEDRHEEAVTLLEAAVATADDRNGQFLAAQARIAAARSMMALGLDDRAHELLDAAESTARALDAHLLLREIAALRSGDAAATGS